MSRMKVAFLYKGYLPGKKYGGTVTSLYNLTELLGDELEIFIICSNHDLFENNPYPDVRDDWNYVGKAKVKYLVDSYYQRDAFERIIQDIRPQVIYVSSIFSALYTYPIVSLAKQYGIPLLLAPRGELLSSALQIKWIKKKLYLYFLQWNGILKKVYYQATSEHEKKEICQNMGVNQDRVFFLPNVPSLPRKKDDIQKDKGRVKICFSGRIVKNKNLFLALKAVMNTKSDIIFDVFGSLEDLTYWNRCRNLIAQLPNNVQVNYLGNLSTLEMREKYYEYHCLISPTEFENYGHSIVEAMMHDVPVIISKGRTPWDDLGTHGAGFVVPLEKNDAFTQAIDEIGQMDGQLYTELIARLRKYCAIKFDLSMLKSHYLDTFSKISQTKGDGAALFPSCY